ncbi:DUF599 domain-containing protein [Jannaschia sp. S6380]|uniref:DUF599 domain-containing protein n=1 Tax=Jannaschia sp. S6380 TaxID=2926408 RepID=UPI0032B12DF8
MMEHLPLLTTLDWLALAGLVLAWAGSTWLIEREGTKRPSVTILMQRYRHDWMQEMLTRDPRNFDAVILSNLRQGTAFFASGSLIALGGVLALAGNAEQLSTIAEEVNLLDRHAAAWQVKLMIGAVLLTHGFLKFVWANRLFGYCAVVMAATPNDPGDPRSTRRAAQSAEINIRAAAALNRGLRSVYFALATIAWLLGWWALMIAVAATIWVIWSREFASTSRQVLLDD